MLYILLSCVLLPFYIFSLSLAHVHTLWILCFMIAHSHAIQRRWWWCTHIVYIEAWHIAYTHYFWVRVKGFFFWFCSKIVSLSNYIGSNLVLLSFTSCVCYSFLDGILACLHFIPLHSFIADRSTQCFNMHKNSHGKIIEWKCFNKKIDVRNRKKNYQNADVWKSFHFFQFTKRGRNNNNNREKKRVQKRIFSFLFLYHSRASLSRSVYIFFGGLRLFWFAIICGYRGTLGCVWSLRTFFRVFQFLTGKC